MFKVGQRVEVSCEYDTVIPLYTQGVVAEINTKRSKHGFHIFVDWDNPEMRFIPKRTWVTLRTLKVAEEVRAT